MSEKSKINRRQFIQRSALGSAAMGMALGEGHGEAPEVPARVPASDKVTVGMIGVGARAQELMQAIMTLPGTEIAFDQKHAATLNRRGQHRTTRRPSRTILFDEQVPRISDLTKSFPCHFEQPHLMR